MTAYRIFEAAFETWKAEPTQSTASPELFHACFNFASMSAGTVEARLTENFIALGDAVREAFANAGKA